EFLLHAGDVPRPPGIALVMRSGSALAEQPQQSRLVGTGHRGGPDQAPLAVPRLADHPVAHAGVGAHHFAAARDLEALGGRAIRFLLGHPFSSVRYRAAVGGPSPCGAVSVFPCGFGARGISTVVSVRPSERGGDSTVATSPRSAIARWISLYPMSWCAISR